MFDPYRMVLVNLITSALVLAGTFCYRFIFPKRKVDLFVLLLVISVLPIISVFRTGTYESGDFNIHVYRSMAFYDALSEGQILPTWAKDLNATYGYPTFIIGAPLTYYSNSLFHFIGFSFITSMKLTLALAFILSGVTMYFWAKKEFGEKGGFTAAVFYIFAPFHLVDLHFRVSPGDTIAFVFLPLILYGLHGIMKSTNIKYVFTTIIGTGLLMLSHPISIVAMTFIFFYVFFLFLREKEHLKKMFTAAFSILWGLLISSFYWLPIVLEKKYIITSVFPDAFSFEKSIADFLYSPWRFGFLFQGPKGELSYTFGFIQIFIIIFTILWFFKGKFVKKELFTYKFFILYLILIFFMLFPVSKPLWDIIPFYKNLQFSYRIMFIVVLLTASIAGIFVSKIKNNYLIVLIILIAVLSTILNWGHRRVIPEITDSVLKQYLPSSTYFVEGGTPAAPVWINTKKNPWKKDSPKSHIEILKGNAYIKTTKRTAIKHEYFADAKSDSIIKENTYYYPSWSLKIDDKKYSIDYTNKIYPGIIIFNLKKGVHKIELSFEDTDLRFILKKISFLSFVMFVFFTLGSFLKRSFKLTS